MESSDKREAMQTEQQQQQQQQQGEQQKGSAAEPVKASLAAAADVTPAVTDNNTNSSHNDNSADKGEVDASVDEQVKGDASQGSGDDGRVLDNKGGADPTAMQVTRDGKGAEDTSTQEANRPLQGNKAFAVLMEELEGHTDAPVEELKETVRRAKEKALAKRNARQAQEEKAREQANKAKAAKKEERSQDEQPAKKAKQQEQGAKHGKGRHYTVSIAIPASIVTKAQSHELRSYLAGQIARAAVLFHVDEIVIYREASTVLDKTLTEGMPINRNKHATGSMKTDPCAFLARLLEYVECPQYLRKHFFRIQYGLKFAGLLPPLDTPHHTRLDTPSPFREGVTLEEAPKNGKGSLVNVGLRRPAQIKHKLEPGVRVTVALDVTQYRKKKVRLYTGKAVSPSTPREERGMYWGYAVRVAETAAAVFEECTWKGGYDLCIGISDKGNTPDRMEQPKSPFKHALLVFGGAQGLAEFTEDMEEDPLQECVNTCPNPGSRTVRTEESLLASLACLTPVLRQHGSPASS